MADVIIVGGGQAGLAASVCLATYGIDHLVLEKGEVGESWRRQRWDNFYMNTPNWTLNLPRQDYAGSDPDGFMNRDEFVGLLEGYAKRFAVPLRLGIEATRASPTRTGWTLETSNGPLTARALIIATSTYQAALPPAVSKNLSPNILSLNAADYRAPGVLPHGKTLVVGSAQSGMQIVEDLHVAGREVLLAVGEAGRVPRRYRGRDLNYWYDKTGLMDRKASDLSDPRRRFGGQPQIAAWHTISLQGFHRNGIRLLGRVDGIDGTMLHLRQDLRENIAAADRHSEQFCRDVDTYIERHGHSFPADEGDDPNHVPLADLEQVLEPDTLSLANEGISSIIWATGFQFDFSWIEADVTDEVAYPVTDRGETTAAGLYFLGLNFLHTRKSGIVYGVGADAEHVATQLRAYLSSE
jgi:putative flavoprotein involved in K+ transport